MRISDWSSDVCSSDLAALPRQMVVVRIKRHAMHHGRAMAAAAKKAVRIDDARRETPPHLVEGAEHAALPPEVIRQRQVQSRRFAVEFRPRQDRKSGV